MPWQGCQRGEKSSAMISGSRIVGDSKNLISEKSRSRARHLFEGGIFEYRFVKREKNGIVSSSFIVYMYKRCRAMKFIKTCFLVLSVFSFGILFGMEDKRVRCGLDVFLEKNLSFLEGKKVGKNPLGSFVKPSHFPT